MAATGTNDLKIFVGNLPYAITNSDIEGLFGVFGPIVGVNIRIDRLTSKSKGYGFVTFETAAAAEQAIEHMHGSAYKGRPLTVRRAEMRGGGKSSEDTEVIATAAGPTTVKGVKKNRKPNWTEWSGPS